MDKAIEIYFVLIYIAVAGAFGGFVSGVYDLLVSVSMGSIHLCDKCRKIWYYFCRTSIGIAGAFGVVAIGIWWEKISLVDTPENTIILIGASVLAGTASYRLLPSIGAKLLKQQVEKIAGDLGRVKKETEELTDAIKVEVAEAKTAMKNEVAEAKKTAAVKSTAATATVSALLLAESVLAGEEYRSSESDLDQAISQMLAVRNEEENRSRRIFNVYLGRLFAMKGQFNEAIYALQGYITAIEEQNPESENAEDIETVKINKAAALYNIACYHVRKALTIAEKNSVDINTNQKYLDLIEESFDYLAKSLELDVTNYECAISSDEHDFDIYQKYPAWLERFNAMIDAARTSVTEKTVD